MLKNSLADLEETGTIGDWAFINDDAYIAICYPDASSHSICILPIKPVVGKPSWDWNGDRERPTLKGHGGSDSIKLYTRRWGVEHVYWHGFLTDGKLINA